MASVRFTKHLKRFFPDLADKETIAGTTAAAIIAGLDAKYPGLAAYIVDERGVLRKHVNIFIAGELIHDRQGLSDKVGEDDQVYIFQALSGGLL